MFTRARSSTATPSAGARKPRSSTALCRAGSYGWRASLTNCWPITRSATGGWRGDGREGEGRGGEEEEMAGVGRGGEDGVMGGTLMAVFAGL